MMTAEQCAERAGVSVRTWRSYVSRGQAPKSAGYDPRTGLQVWEDDDVQQWVENRPGQGARSTTRAIERARSRCEDEG